jgi:hypothetical protein
MTAIGELVRMNSNALIVFFHSLTRFRDLISATQNGVDTSRCGCQNCSCGKRNVGRLK